MHMKNNSKHCLNQKDETCPKDSKDVENHAFSEWNFTEHAESRGYGSSRYIVNTVTQMLHPQRLHAFWMKTL